VALLAPASLASSFKRDAANVIVALAEKEIAN